MKENTQCFIDDCLKGMSSELLQMVNSGRLLTTTEYCLVVCCFA